MGLHLKIKNTLKNFSFYRDEIKKSKKKEEKFY